jgi:acetyl-CoA carboxylase carboxyl transferase subunit alpha
MEYLDFESDKRARKQLDKCLVIGQESDVDVLNTCKQINKKLIETKKVYIKLDSMATCSVRHPNRPYTLDHIKPFGLYLELRRPRVQR